MNINYRELNPFFIRALRGDTGLLGNQTEQEKFLKQLGPALTTLPGFKDNKRWTSESNSSDVLNQCLKTFVRLANDNRLEWQLNFRKEKYVIDTMVPTFFHYDCYFHSCCYLPVLDRYDEDLFNLMFYLIVYFHKVQRMKIWDEESQHSAAAHDHGPYYEMMLEEENYGKEQEESNGDYYKKLLDKYNYKSDVNKYRKLIERAGFSPRVWKAALNNFKPNTPVRKAFDKVLMLGLELIESGEHFNSFINNPQQMEEYDESPLNPTDTVRFCWDSNDAMAKFIIHHLESYEQGTGSVPFYQFIPIEDKSDFTSGYKVSKFPGMLLNFMETAERVYQSLYKKAWPNGLKIPKPKDKKLINILFPKEKKKCRKTAA